MKYKPNSTIIFLLFCLIFFMLIIINYLINRNILKQAIHNQQENSTKSAAFHIQKSIEEKITSIVSIKNLIENGDNIKDILTKSQKVANFKSVYIGYEDNTIISSQKWQKPKDYKVTKRPWYQNTINQNQPYITKEYKDVGLKIDVISICTKLKKYNKQAVVCGILSLENIKKILIDISLANDANVILVDKNDNFMKNKYNTFKKTHLYSIANINNTHWEILVLTDKGKAYKRLNNQLLISSIIFLVSIVVFLFFSIYYKLKEKQKQNILFQQSKMADLGEMIGAISHQWSQPLNSLSLMLGNLKHFKKLNKLDDEIFDENIKLSLASIDFLSDTIYAFKNFYKNHSKAENFDLKKAVDEVQFIANSYINNANIKIIQEIKTSNLECYNFKNYIQQIIIILLFNSRDAIKEAKILTNIQINIEDDENNFKIYIQDYGCGIKKEIKDKIFKSFFTTKADKGTGNGLFISKLIAKEKIKGDIMLINLKNPTKFLLKFPKVL